MIQRSEPITLLDLAERVKELSNGSLLSALSEGSEGTLIQGIAPLETAGDGEVSFLASPKYRDEAKQCHAAALILTEEDKKALWGDEIPPRACVITRNPYAWFAYALQVIFPRDNVTPGIHPGACIDPSAYVAPTARIDKGVVIKAGARIGEHCEILANTVIAEDVVIGDNTKIYPNVSIYYGCRIGKNNIIHSGAVIGADGFGFAPLDLEYVKIPQVGIVETGDNVEIGANTCIDRGALNNTTVGNGSKIDDLVMIGHNCQIGKNVVISGRSGMAGSSIIGDNCQLGGGAGIAGHLSIAPGTIIGANGGVPKTIDKPGYYAGHMPAMPHREFFNILSVIKKLPEMRRQLKRLTEEVKSLKGE
ncbi:MAG: UDP-3-O-(3-hydroxymyristoyl)glucosamine N-acyltransferase [Burkholderiales bacterium]|nr:UDP-3-O-(3-hydroxymyristoyl)glucosamine N-acyltransferase [Burkholderiales bacterium]